MLYAVLGLLFLLATACAGFGFTGAAEPYPYPEPSVVLTPPAPPTDTPIPPPQVPSSTHTPVLAPTLLPTLPPTPVPAPEPTSQLVPYVQVAAGRAHTCVLRADGVARCWGQNPDGETNVPPRMRFQQISAGNGFTCGLRYAGDIACWGNNRYGKTDAPPGLFTQIAASNSHACALDSDGVLVCWGAVVDPLPAEQTFTAIGAGVRYGCGLTSAGDLHCWGWYGINVAGPFQALAVGPYHVCVLRRDGTAACYGRNWHYRDSPPIETAFTQIAAGDNHSCGITTEGVLECWGAGLPGAAGQRLDAPDGVFTALSIYRRNNCALRPDGTVQCWQQRNLDPAARNIAKLVPAFEGRIFNQPVELFPWPAGGLAVVDLTGFIKAYDDSAGGRREPELILDLTDRTVTGIERGMLSAALDPNFDEFPFLYVYYIGKVGAEQQIAGQLSRFPVVDGGAVRADELVILNLPQPREFHQGGAIRFGPDGMLYLGLGDNGNKDDSQNLAARRGKIIRIDVRGAAAEQPYRIPDDNPFLENPGARPEIWAYGLRNPWRMDFDADGKLWVADVNESNNDEISIATAGANLGWPIWEGNSCNATADDCAALVAATTPELTYSRLEGGCAVIGGVTSRYPELPYIFGDHCSRWIWGLMRDDTAATGWRMQVLARADSRILSFGTDAAGAVLVLLLESPIMRMEW